MMTRIVPALLLSCAAAGVFAQSAAPPTTLDVASVKRRDPNDWTNIGIQNRPGTVVANNFPLRGLISIAYRVQGAQVVGLPDWVTDSEKYDVVAKSVEAVGGGDAMASTLRAVLEDRFKLRIHRETRELPVLAMLAVRSGVPGPRLRPSPVTCVAGPVSAAAAQADTRPRCVVQMPPGRMIGVGIDTRLLASSIGAFLNQVVVDKTGFSGGFDVDLEYVPQPGAAAAAAPVPAPGDGLPFRPALEEQLGIRLDNDRADVEVIVVDSIDRPTDN